MSRHVYCERCYVGDESPHVCPENKWTRQERGWWTHPVLGGVCRERDGWWWWHALTTDKPVGPFVTLREAFRAATLGGNAR